MKSLVKLEDGYALILDRTLMDLVGIFPEAPVMVQVSGQSLILTSSQTPPVSLGRTMEKVLASHAGVLGRLSK